MEWELGSRVMNDQEVENHRFTKFGAIIARIERAGHGEGDTELTVDDVLECIISVDVPGMEESMFYVYDALESGRLVAAQVHPIITGEKDRTLLFDLKEVTDYCPWEDYEGVTTDANL